MGRWNHKVEGFGAMLTTAPDHAAVQATMTAIADRLKQDPWFSRFDFTQFYNLPEGDDFFAPSDYADRILARLYDYCDRERIWLDPKGAS